MRDRRDSSREGNENVGTWSWSHEIKIEDARAGSGSVGIVYSSIILPVDVRSLLIIFYSYLFEIYCYVCTRTCACVCVFFVQKKNNAREGRGRRRRRPSYDVEIFLRKRIWSRWWTTLRKLYVPTRPGKKAMMNGAPPLAYYSFLDSFIRRRGG